MRRVALCLFVACAVGAAAAFSGSRPTFQFKQEKLNPVTHLRWNQGPEVFQFAIVSDRTGGHRANIFSQAVHKLNLLQPEFVVSVGDLIETSRGNDVLTKSWGEFDGYLQPLSMPFFYVSGNHDVGTAESAKFWDEKLGRRHYHFLYRQVLFLVLNSEDPALGGGSLGADQIAWAQKTLADNQGARWTIVLIHRPLWTGNVEKNGWLPVERALEGRRYTVFCGHLHRYQKYVRNGQNYYQLATTGGSSRLRGMEAGEFDHITWVTMKSDGPLLANLRIDAIHAEDLRPVKTDEPGRPAKRQPLLPLAGRVYYDGVPAAGAQVVFAPVKGGVRAEGVAAADGSFLLTTYLKDDGAAEGEYAITVTQRLRDAKGALGANQLPVRYAAAATSGLRATIAAGKTVIDLELTK